VFIAFVMAGVLVVERALVVAGLLLSFWPRYVELRKPIAVPAREWLLGILVGLAVFVAWINLDQGWMVTGRLGDSEPAQPWLRLAGFALVVPVMEELFWRSFLLRWIDSRDFLGADPRKASARALAIVSVLFAAEHSFWLAGLVAGIAYTWLYVRSGSLWIPIVSHTTTNATLGLWILATGNSQYW
jgi:CAAX protease family protein